MRNLFAISFLLHALFCASVAVKAECGCEKFSATRFRAGSDPILLRSEMKVSKIQGRVFNAFGAPPASPSKTDIYLFRKPVSTGDQEFTIFSLEAEEILAACETGKDGNFCFENFPREKYIICANTPADSSFMSKTTCAFIDLKPENKKSVGAIKIPLEIQDL